MTSDWSERARCARGTRRSASDYSLFVDHQSLRGPRRGCVAQLVEPGAPGQRDPFGAGRRHDDLVAAPLEQEPREVGVRFVVLDHQYAHWLATPHCDVRNGGPADRNALVKILAAVPGTSLPLRDGENISCVRPWRAPPLATLRCRAWQVPL